MRKIWAVVAFALCLTPVAGYAVSSADLQSALERAELAARRTAASETYKGFNPHLTEAQMREIPQLLEDVVARINGGSGAGVTTGMFAGYMFMYLKYSEDIILEDESKDLFLATEKLRLHAWDYAFFKLISEDLRNDPDTYYQVVNGVYSSANYPEITNWKEFHDMCQERMERVYETLKSLKNGSDDDIWAFCHLLT